MLDNQAVRRAINTELGKARDCGRSAVLAEFVFCCAAVVWLFTESDTAHVALVVFSVAMVAWVLLVMREIVLRQRALSTLALHDRIRSHLTDTTVEGPTMTEAERNAIVLAVKKQMDADK